MTQYFNYHSGKSKSKLLPVHFKMYMTMSFNITESSKANECNNQSVMYVTLFMLLTKLAKITLVSNEE